MSSKAPRKAARPKAKKQNTSILDRSARNRRAVSHVEVLKDAAQRKSKILGELFARWDKRREQFRSLECSFRALQTTAPDMCVTNQRGFQLSAAASCVPASVWEKAIGDGCPADEDKANHWPIAADAWRLVLNKDGDGAEQWIKSLDPDRHKKSWELVRWCIAVIASRVFNAEMDRMTSLANEEIPEGNLHPFCERLRTDHMPYIPRPEDMLPDGSRPWVEAETTERANQKPAPNKTYYCNIPDGVRIELSTIQTAAVWRKVFGRGKNDIIPLLKNGQLRVKQVSDRGWQVALDDIPATSKAKYSAAEKRPASPVNSR